MNSRYFLGLAISTLGVRAILINQKQEIIATSWTEHSTYTPHPLWVEQNPEDWWLGTVASIRKIFESKNIIPNQIEAISLTGQMHGLVLLDGYGHVIRPCILWNDQRSISQCEQMYQDFGRDEIISYTGNRVYPGFTAPKVVWVQQNEAHLYQKTAKIMLPKDYIRYRLSGSYYSEVTDASGTSLFNVQKRKWSKEMLIALHISPSLLPDVTESSIISSTVSPEASRITGLFQGTPIVAGASSHAAEALAARIFQQGDLALSIRSSGTVFAPLDEYRIDQQGRIHCFCSIMPNKWHLMGVMLSAGAAFRWFRDQFMDTLSYDEITAIAATAPAGSEGLLFLPYLNGERNPYPDPYAKGVFFGFGFRHQKAHFARSLMEGICFGLRDSVELIKELDIAVHGIKAFGGAAQSKLWMQIMCDILHHPLSTTRDVDEPAYGAALLAAIGQGCISFEELTKQKSLMKENYVPGNCSDRYQELYPHYHHLYQTLSSSYKELFNTVCQFNLSSSDGNCS